MPEILSPEVFDHPERRAVLAEEGHRQEVCPIAPTTVAPVRDGDGRAFALSCKTIVRECPSVTTP